MELAQNTTSKHASGMSVPVALLEEIDKRFGPDILARQKTCDGIPTYWIDRSRIKDFLRFLRDEADPRFEMMYDLTAIDERMRVYREGQPDSDFTVVYHLMSFRGNVDLRIKVPLQDNDLSIPSVADIWPSANWYEREVWDMFAVKFDGHPNLYRLVLPPTWEGHPLRKEQGGAVRRLPGRG